MTLIATTLFGGKLPFHELVCKLILPDLPSYVTKRTIKSFHILQYTLYIVLSFDVEP